MPAQLKDLSGGPSILLDKPISLLGRHPECDIQIDSRKVSRRHCCIAQVDDHLVVRDLGSTNGIRINGERVVEGRLHDGDELTVGNHRYQVLWQDSAGGNGHAREAVHEAHSPAESKPVDDDLLEACDEPVPLAEPPLAPMPDGIKPAGRGRPPLPPSNAQAKPERENMLPVPLHDLPAARNVPEHIELAPPSDAYSHPSSGSHHLS